MSTQGKPTELKAGVVEGGEKKGGKEVENKLGKQNSGRERRRVVKMGRREGRNGCMEGRRMEWRMDTPDF